MSRVMAPFRTHSTWNIQHLAFNIEPLGSSCKIRSPTHANPVHPLEVSLLDLAETREPALHLLQRGEIEGASRHVDAVSHGSGAGDAEPLSVHERASDGRAGRARRAAL